MQCNAMQDVSPIEERKSESPILEGPTLKGLRSPLYNSPHFRHKETESDIQKLELTLVPKMTKSLKEHIMIKTKTNCSQARFLSPILKLMNFSFLILSQIGSVSAYKRSGRR